MGDTTSRSNGGSNDPAERRAFLRRAATVGTVAWAAPAILTMRAGSAAAMTSPPGLIDDNQEETGPADLAAQAQEPLAAGELPRTGADLDKLTAAGLTAGAAGGALLWWSGSLEAQAEASLPEAAGSNE